MLRDFSASYLIKMRFIFSFLHLIFSLPFFNALPSHCQHPSVCFTLWYPSTCSQKCLIYFWKQKHWYSCARHTCNAYSGCETRSPIFAFSPTSLAICSLSLRSASSARLRWVSSSACVFWSSCTAISMSSSYLSQSSSPAYLGSLFVLRSASFSLRRVLFSCCRLWMRRFKCAVYYTGFQSFMHWKSRHNSEPINIVFDMWMNNYIVFLPGRGQLTRQVTSSLGLPSLFST